MENQVTPRKLAQRIIRLDERGNQSRDSELDDREVVDIIMDVANKLLKINMFQERQGNLNKSVPAHYIHTFRKVPLKIKTSTTIADSVNFITLPAKYASLPHNAGVRFIYPDTDNFYKNEPMIPINQGECFMFEGLLGNMQKKWVYSLEGDEVYFKKRCGKTLCEAGIQYVNVVLVTIIGDISMDTPLNVPPELHLDIIEGSLALLGSTYGIKQVKDKINDNNPDEVRP